MQSATQSENRNRAPEAFRLRWEYRPAQKLHLFRNDSHSPPSVSHSHDADCTSWKWRADLSQTRFWRWPVLFLQPNACPLPPALPPQLPKAQRCPEGARDPSPWPSVLGQAVRTRPSAMVFELRFKEDSAIFSPKQETWMQTAAQGDVFSQITYLARQSLLMKVFVRSLFPLLEHAFLQHYNCT